MKIIIGTVLLFIFILTVGTIAVTYVFAVNNNINNMLKKKGFKNYKNFKKSMESKSTSGSLAEDRKIKSDNCITKHNYKMNKKEEKKQVEEYLYYELSKKRK